ncbi:peroxiredoxin family protein [Alteribacter natronophilus]|uniref:peroxiredoxin family protein n=1 Tax=Alteribacter natronophilus TaxID=2583810 RepID=UPI00148710CA|nr:TlpA disulfide reductase family protein [Alteribacter natronophilus]
MRIIHLRKWPLIITCLLLAAGAFWASQSEHDWAQSQRAMVEADAEAPAAGVQEGETVSDIQLPDKNGERQSLYDLTDGKKAAVVFFTTWCEVCTEHWGGLQELKQAGKLENTEIVGVHLKSIDDDADLHDYFSGWESLPILVDGDGKVKKQFEIIGMPTVYLVDEQNQIQRRVLGPLTPHLIEKDPFFAE